MEKEVESWFQLIYFLSYTLFNEAYSKVLHSLLSKKKKKKCYIARPSNSKSCFGRIIRDNYSGRSDPSISEIRDPTHIEY